MPSFNIPAPGGSIPAYLALPAGADPAPGILVLHDLGGLPESAVDSANRFAEAGFLALSVASGQLCGMDRCMRSLARDLLGGSGPAFAGLQACSAWLAGQARCTGRVGLSCTCVTGGFVMLVVLDGGFALFDGATPKRFPAEVEAFLGKECPIIDDAGNRKALNESVVRALERSLEKALKTLNTRKQPAAELMFMNDLRVFWFKLLRLPPAGADAAAADEFQRNVAAFLSSHLDAPVPRSARSDRLPTDTSSSAA